MVRIYSTHFNPDNFKDNGKVNTSAGTNEPIFNFKPSPKTDNFEVNPSDEMLDRHNSVDSKWRETYSEYTPKNKVKYNKVHKFVENYAKKQGNTTADIDAITNMICKLSDDYGIDPEITAVILAHETGGFVFTPKVMSARKNYKGVAQVDYTIIEILYASYSDRKNKSLSDHQRAVANDHRHCLQDQARIDELKKKYPTPQDLWKAIQTDVSLGLEVGIMAFKMKLHAKDGNTAAALSKYCANQYHLPADSTAKMQYNLPLPKYQSTTNESVEEEPTETAEESETAQAAGQELMTYSQKTIRQILLDSMELKNYMSAEEKEEYNSFADNIKYTEDGKFDIDDIETLEAIYYFEKLISEKNKITEEYEEEFDF